LQIQSGITQMASAQNMYYQASVQPQSVGYAQQAQVLQASVQPQSVGYPQQAQVLQASAEPQVLRDLGAGWLQCQDNQGIFYFNQVTQQSSDDLPAELRTPAQVVQAPVQPQFMGYAQQPQMPQIAPASQATVKQQIGDWLICVDALGEFYVNARTQQQLDQAPAELLYQVQAAQQQKLTQPQAQVVTQQVAMQQPQYQTYQQPQYQTYQQPQGQMQYQTYQQPQYR
jgi:hypothetical protein